MHASFPRVLLIVQRRQNVIGVTGQKESSKQGLTPSRSECVFRWSRAIAVVRAGVWHGSLRKVKRKYESTKVSPRCLGPRLGLCFFCLFRCSLLDSGPPAATCSAVKAAETVSNQRVLDLHRAWQHLSINRSTKRRSQVLIAEQQRSGLLNYVPIS